MLCVVKEITPHWSIRHGGQNLHRPTTIGQHNRHFPSDRQRTQPPRIPAIDRIIPDIRIEIIIIPIPDRVRLQEPPERRRVEPGLVVIQPERREIALPGIAEARPRRRVGLAERPVGVDRRIRAARARLRDDTALMIAVQPGLVPRPAARIGHQRLVDPRAMHVTPLHRVRRRRVILGDQIASVIDQTGRSRALRRVPSIGPYAGDCRCRRCMSTARRR